nr:MAG TPA: hypothetical protein [Caudoviricetes sp.]
MPNGTETAILLSYVLSIILFFILCFYDFIVLL